MSRPEPAQAAGAWSGAGVPLHTQAEALVQGLRSGPLCPGCRGGTSSLHRRVCGGGGVGGVRSFKKTGIRENRGRRGQG